jgi:tRNA (cmo5U34)-methyltransferase
MTGTLKVGDDLQVTDGAWSFQTGVAATFVDHVRRSVPHYDDGHELVAQFSSCFVRPDGLAYELGAATGQLLKRVATATPRNRSARWIGIDNQPEMVEQAREHCREVGNVTLLEGDISTVAYRRCDFVIAYLTLDFLDHEPRTRTLRRVHQALRPGGALFLFEKVLAPDARLQNLITLLHYRFKREQGLTADEILNKADSLAGVMQPMTSGEHVALLRRCGFTSISSVLKHLCFEGFIAIK